MNFLVLSAEWGSTKGSSFPDPLPHPRMGRKRSLKVVTAVNMAAIPRQPAAGRPMQQTSDKKRDRWSGMRQGAVAKRRNSGDYGFPGKTGRMVGERYNSQPGNHLRTNRFGQVGFGMPSALGGSVDGW